MNLVLAGMVDDSLRNHVIELTSPLRSVPLMSGSWRLEGVHVGSEVQSVVAACCDSARIDHAYVEDAVHLSDMKLLAMDMDSTLITIECIDEIADLLGKKREVAAITEATMRGEIKDFSESLRRRAHLLAGADVDVLRRVFEERLKITAGAAELISAAHDSGLQTLLVSGGFTYFTDRLRVSLDLTAAFANELICKNGRLTGELVEPVFTASDKADRVCEALSLIGASRHQAIAIGDGANDIPMMEQVHFSIAYRAKPALRSVARYAITYGSLRNVLDLFQ